VDIDAWKLFLGELTSFLNATPKLGKAYELRCCIILNLVGENTLLAVVFGGFMFLTLD
jgi:hypothetical protein|tara:strand:- start:218 stop:391 length:174 start_codon:yes stop_codon:yes gene_type:complete